MECVGSEGWSVWGVREWSVWGVRDRVCGE